MNKLLQLMAEEKIESTVSSLREEILNKGFDQDTIDLVGALAGEVMEVSKELQKKFNAGEGKRPERALSEGKDDQDIKELINSIGDTLEESDDDDQLLSVKILDGNKAIIKVNKSVVNPHLTPPIIGGMLAGIGISVIESIREKMKIDKGDTRTLIYYMIDGFKDAMDALDLDELIENLD